MSNDEIHPELAGYEPGDGRPLRNPMTLRVMRVVVILGLVGLVLPGILVGVSTAQRTAEVACDIVVESEAPDAVDSAPAFELGGPAGPGWYCYEITFGGDREQLRYLGLIPELQRAPWQNPDPDTENA